MTITTSGPAMTGPLNAIPAVQPGPASAQDGAATPADFATLVAQLVAAGAPSADLVEDAGAAGGDTPDPAEPEAPADGEVGTALDPTALLMAVPPAVAPPVAAAVRAVSDPGVDAGVAAAAAPDVTVDLPPAGSSPVPPEGPSGLAEGPGAVPATDQAGPADPSDPSATRSGSEPTSPQAAPSSAQPTGQAAPSPVAPAGMTPGVPAGALPPSPATTAHPAPAPAPPAVAQVVPEVTRLVSRGDGVHRLTMRLQPEALGEVRVTLTVRDGAVQVHLSGGEDAARALAEGAPELRRVLELAGAGDARVVVRDLAGNQPTPHSQPALGGSADAASYGADGDAPSPGTPGGGTGQQDHHARTRGGAGATDGLTDGAPTLRPDPVSGARQGIDLTM